MEGKPRKKRPGPVVIERELLRSNAYFSLTGKASQVLMMFLAKRQMAKVPAGKRKVWEISNNGEIVFPYSEAEKFGISAPTFTRALDQLLDRGFLDITFQGTGICGVATKYAISDRWKAFGSPDFERKKRSPRLLSTFPRGSANPRKRNS